jgi:hypothetical protein
MIYVDMDGVSVYDKIIINLSSIIIIIATIVLFIWDMIATHRNKSQRKRTP